MAIAGCLTESFKVFLWIIGGLFLGSLYLSFTGSGLRFQNLVIRMDDDVGDTKRISFIYDMAHSEEQADVKYFQRICSSGQVADECSRVPRNLGVAKFCAQAIDLCRTRYLK